MKFENKVAIVTGAGGGIGRAVATSLASEGAAIVVNDIRQEPLDKVADEIRALGQKVLAMKADVTNSKEIYQMVQSTLNEFGRIDILVNVAGGPARGDKRTLFHEAEEETWNSVIDLNLKGTLICCHAVIRQMLQQRYGKIVNIGSVQGMVGSSIGFADYSAAKAGVIGFTKSLAKEVVSFGINFNCVSPGVVATPQLFWLPEEVIEKLKDSVYLKRLGKPEEIANLVVFLVSDEASYITGQNYAICGGRSLGL